MSHDSTPRDAVPRLQPGTSQAGAVPPERAIPEEWAVIVSAVIESLVAHPESDRLGLAHSDDE